MKNKRLVNILFALFIILQLVGSAAAANWPMFMADSSHSGQNGDSGPTGINVGIKWQSSLGGTSDISPVIFGDYIYLITNEVSSSVLHAVNKNTGAEIKSCIINSARTIGTSAVYSTGDKLYVPLSNDIFQVNTISVPSSWENNCPGAKLNTNLQPTSSIIIEDDAAYFGSNTWAHR